MVFSIFSIFPYQFFPFNWIRNVALKYICNLIIDDDGISDSDATDDYEVVEAPIRVLGRYLSFNVSGLCRVWLAGLVCALGYLAISTVFFFVSVFGLILVGGVLTVLPFSAIFPTFVLLLLTARSTIKKKNNSNALQIILKIKKKLVCNLLLYSEQLNYY